MKLHFIRQLLRLATSGLTLALCVGLSSALTVDAAPACPPSPYRSPKPLIIAHASGNYFGPPNTLEMMRAAKAAGAQVLDADVRVTKDAVLVASHDDVIILADKSTRSIASSTLAELQAINVGATWPGPKKDFPLRSSNVHIPTIESVLRSFPKNRIGLEFKTTGGERQLCRLLRTLQRTKDVFVSSAGDAPVDRFIPICPEVATTVTDAMVLQFRDARLSGKLWCAPVPIGQPPLRAGADFRLDRQGVRWEQEHGLAVYTWTADDRASLQLAKDLGVDGVYTARPDLARAIFR